MRIHSLRFAALGPFAGEEVIDFDALGPSALFLIDGPTGAGKSTIIDAIVFALYGDVAGEASDKERLRSAFATSETESFAEIDLSTMAGRFRVRRSPAYERAKKRGTGTTSEPATVQVWRSIGEQTWEPLSVRHAEADAEITRAVGLTRGQFLQTVVLPQGEFATFLRSESADRLPILERIFATEVYARIQSAFDDERRAALRARELSLHELQSARDVLRGQLEGTESTIEVEHDPSRWPDERDALLARLRAEVTATAAATSACELALADATAHMDTLVAAEQAAKAASSARARLESATSRVARLESVLAFHGDAASLEGRIIDLEADLQAAAADLAIETALPTLEKQAQVTQARVIEHDRLLAELEGDRDRVIPARMAASVAGLREEVRATEESVLNQEKHVGALRLARASGLAGELAHGLADGEACPVCGSVEHPSPAPMNPDSVSADHVTEQEQLLDSQREQLEALRTSVAVITATVPAEVPVGEPARASRQALLEALEGDIRALEGISVRLEEMRTQRAEAVSSLRDLETRIESDRARIASARGDHASIADLVHAHRERRDRLVELREARAIQRQARDQVESLVVDEGGPVHENGELAMARDAREASGAAARRAASVSSSAARLLDVVSALCAGVDAAQLAHDDVARNSASTIRIAQALNGSGGQSLSAYVVQRAFDEVIEAANVRLASMLGGHFRLVTTHERTGSRRTGLGLGLKVRDLRTDTERRTTTLSGGESFCASLALALGLADSVRAHAGGVEIGMLFIDEGFGALDVERLGDVMSELLRLKSDGRSVGVISHVTEMKRAIPERVDVVPAPGGSTLSVRWMP